MVIVAGCGGAQRGSVVVSEAPDGIVVVEEGEALARPDIAMVRVGVEARAATVADARQTAASAQQAVLDALRRGGVADDDLQTEVFSVMPEYEHTDRGQNLLGYTVRNIVSARVRELESLSRVIDAALGAGGDLTRLDSLSFEVSDPFAARAEARAAAMREARATAEQLAGLAGVELGQPVAIEEMQAGGGPIPFAMEARAADSAATPIEPGTTEVRVQLRVRWAVR